MAKPQIRGGFNPVDVNDAEVQRVASFAAGQLTSSADGAPQSLVRVLEAQKQVVNGLNYRLKIETNEQVCTVNIFEQAREDILKVNDVSCVLSQALFVAARDTDQVADQTTTTRPPIPPNCHLDTDGFIKCLLG